MGIEGSFIWKLKDNIDRKWISGYQELPNMEEMKKSQFNGGKIVSNSIEMDEESIALLSASKMRCGGCGSKVGSQVLSRVLQAVHHLIYTERTDVVAGIGHRSNDDAAIILPPLPPYYTVQSIDYFRSFVSDPYVFGRIAANHGHAVLI